MGIKQWMGGIRVKLIGIFVVIKVVPLLLLAVLAWGMAQRLGEAVSDQAETMAETMLATIKAVADEATGDAIAPLDDKSREAIERLTTDTARAVAAFLYDRDADVLQAARIEPTEGAYRDFLVHRTRMLYRHGAWKLAEERTRWEPAMPETWDEALAADPKNALPDNAKAFSARPQEYLGQGERRPLFVEMSFVDLKGRERVKVTTGDLTSQELRDISRPEETFVKAERYWKVKDRPQDPAFKAAEHTDRIDFDCKGVNADWLSLSDRSSQHGYRCIRVVAHSPAVGARLAAGAPLVAAAVVIEGRTVADSVPIALQRRPVMQATINGKREVSVQYDRQRKAWLLPPITVQFVLPGDGNPVAVDCIFATPPARIAPALLKITRVERAGLQTVISVEVDTSKETRIAKYFRGSGSIQVTIVATAADGAARYEDSVADRLVPAYELRVEQTTGVDSATLPRRALKRNGVGPELDLSGWKFIADAHDDWDCASTTRESTSRGIRASRPPICASIQSG